MKLISYKVRGKASYGSLTDGGVHDLGARVGTVFPDLKSYLGALSLGSLTAAQTPGSAIDYSVNDIVFDPVIPNPEKIICVGLNYEEHRQETGRQKSEYPTLFTRFADTLVGHRGAIVLPSITKALDYEGELAVIIGRSGFRVPREKALDLVGGYSCFNDASLRDWQRHTHQFIPGKNFPGTGGFGPALVTGTLDNFGDRTIQTLLNGEVMQSAVLGDMIFSVADIIAYVSSFTRLAPGDVIATGTPGGVGFKHDPPLYMKAGDKIEVLIDGVGHLVNRIEDEAADRN